MGGLAGWQWLFLLEGLPSVLLGVWTLFYLDDGIRAARWLSEDDKALLERELAAERSQQQQLPRAARTCVSICTLLVKLFVLVKYRPCPLPLRRARAWRHEPVSVLSYW
jgi:MFS family permease